MTFKDLRRIIAEKKKEMEQESKSYDPNCYWNGKKIVSLDQWYQIKEGYGLKAASNIMEAFKRGEKHKDAAHSYAIVTRDMEIRSIKIP